MRILLIAYHYPPDTAVGSLRAAKVAEAFRKRGHTVQVITARLPSDVGRSRPAETGISVRTVRVLPGPRDWWAWIKRVGHSRPREEGGEVAVDPATPARAPWWKRLILSLIWTPDDRQGFILPALLVSLPRVWRADLVYSTAPPFSDHLVGLLLRWLSWKRWVAEFRDPWTDNSWKPDNARTGFSDALNRWLERRTLRSAFRIVSVSDGIEARIAQRLPESDRTRLLVVRNGIDELLPLRASRKDGKPVRIVHIGTFYFNRDPMPFLRALADVRRMNGPAFEVDLVGHCRWYRGSSVEDAASRLGLGDVVRFQDWVPHAEGQRLTRSADLLLLLAQGQPAQVPNKLYEYLGTRIPILAFADTEGESARMLREIGGHVVVGDVDDQQIRNAVISAFRLAGDGTVSVADDVLRAWTTEAQMERLVSAVEPE